MSPQEEKEAREEKKEETQTYGLQKTSFAKMLEEFTKEEEEEEEARKRERNMMEAEDRRVGRMGEPWCGRWGQLGGEGRCVPVQ